MLPRNHHRIGDSYLNLGTVYHSLNKVNDAIECFETALKICKKTHGEKHPSIANCFTNLALSLKSLGKHKESQDNFQKALDIYKEFYPREHPSIKNIKSQISTKEITTQASKNAKISPQKKSKPLSQIMILKELNLDQRSPNKKDPKYMYRMQLENLKELGFLDEEKNLKTLISVRGNIAEAMNILNK